MASSPSSSEISPKSEPVSPNSSPTPLSLTITNSRPSTTAPPVRASAHKKDKKNVREKRRRGELNRKFDTLRELLSIGEGKSKVEKSHILSEAISAIESLKKRNHELVMIVSQYSGSGSGSSSTTLARNPLLSQSSSGGSSMNLAPFMNMLPNMSSNADPASVAGSTLLAQMSANQFQRPHNSQQSQQSSSTQNPLSQSSHSAFLNQLQSLIPNQSMSLNNPPVASNTPTPLPYGGGSNQQQQSFPSFAGQQMSPSLAFTQQLQQQFAQQQQIQQQFQQMQHQQQHSNSMSVLNNNNSNQQNMLGLPSASQSITRGSSHASLNDHSLNQQQHR